MEGLAKYLWEAAGKEKDEISLDNPYRDIGFDGDLPRLGWVKPVSFDKIKFSLESILPFLEGKENFIFIGMGGSINGIKPLLSLFGKKNFFTLDSLDPSAINDILGKIDNLENVLVIAISKSGTTKETQLLAQTLKNYYIDKVGNENWFNHFLWLADPESFPKLDKLGWPEAKKIPIQPNQKSDIGGRFSSPQTNIFILPLFLLLSKDFQRLSQLYSAFAARQPQISKEAFDSALEVKGESNFYFSPLVEEKWSQDFQLWVVQLFQESLGGKDENKSIKTIVNFSGQDFIKLKLKSRFNDPVLLIMAQMYYYQLFVAYLAGRWRVNFVDQEFVEKYKKKMQVLEGREAEAANFFEADLDCLAAQARQKITSQHRFLEIVLYFWPDSNAVSFFLKKFSALFNQKTILVFVGSDWNHQSYQSAFGDKDTFYLLVCLSKYQKPKYVSEERACENIETLRRIALATHQTLPDKSILFNLKWAKSEQ